jgi:hypothetical protein
MCTANDRVHLPRLEQVVLVNRAEALAQRLDQLQRAGAEHQRRASSAGLSRMLA